MVAVVVVVMMQDLPMIVVVVVAVVVVVVVVAFIVFEFVAFVVVVAVAQRLVSEPLFATASSARTPSLYFCCQHSPLCVRNIDAIAHKARHTPVAAAAAARMGVPGGTASSESVTTNRAGFTSRVPSAPRSSLGTL